MPPKTNQKKDESQLPEASVTPSQITPIPKNTPDYKVVWAEIKANPEYGFWANQEGYEKLNCIFLYKILKLLEEKK